MTPTEVNPGGRGSSALRGWLALVFGHDANRRLLVALAASIALHEIIAGLIPWHSQTLPPPERITVVRLTRIEHRAPPTSPPTPKPVVRTHVVAVTNPKPTIISPARPSENQHIRRIAQRRPLIRTHYHSRPAPIHVAMGGHGASTSTGAATTGGTGTGGAGTGESGNGTGTGGAPAANEPCGFVEFVPVDGVSNIDAQTGGYTIRVRMTVHFPDHTSQSIDLDYLWHYPTEAANPWSEQNLNNPNFPTLFQAPPPDKAADEPDLVQYVVTHSTADGYTKLKDCPGDPRPGASAGG